MNKTPCRCHCKILQPKLKTPLRICHYADFCPYEGGWLTEYWAERMNMDALEKCPEFQAAVSDGGKENGK